MGEPDPDIAREAIEYCYEHDWTDGLPVVPASRELVDRFLAETDRAPDEVLWRMDHLGRECTVQTAAINTPFPSGATGYHIVDVGITSGS